MRTLCLSIAAAVAICVANRASAELIIYKGTLKQSAVGLGVNQKLNSQFYLIVDHDTANVVEIQSINFKGSKTYATSTETNLHFVQMSGAKGKTIQAIAHSPNECDVDEGASDDGVFVQGADATLTLQPGSTVVFPKTLSGTASQVSNSSGPIYIESTLVVGFDTKQTPLSNGNAETLDQALTRISSILEGEGYQKQSLKSKSSRYPLSLVEVDR